VSGKKDYSQLLEARRYDANKEPPKEQVIFLIESKNIGAVQNFITVTGMQKSGKTTFLSAMIAAGLINAEVLGMRLHLAQNKRRVAYWDTEQGDYDFYRTMERTRFFCGVDEVPGNLDAFNLREDEPKDIIALIETYLKQTPDCGLMVIDGILDLIESYNDEGAAKRLVNWLKKISKARGLLMILTLHTGKTTANTLGHLGSMADRAAQSILRVEKNKERNTFILKSDYLRSAEDFTPIEIYFNKEAHTWHTTIYNPDDDKPLEKRRQIKPFEIDTDEHKHSIIKIFSLATHLSYKELVQNICEVYATGQNWAKECVKYFVKEGLIIKTDLGYTNRSQAKLFIKN
jgi:KaiC/GvpD/RAD55 family RecA-like ATPase